MKKHPDTLTDQLVDNAVSRVGPGDGDRGDRPDRVRGAGRAPVARRLTRSGAVDLPTSALVDVTMLTLSDLVARHAFPRTAIPVGVVTVPRPPGPGVAAGTGDGPPLSSGLPGQLQPGGAQGQVALLGQVGGHPGPRW